MNNHKIFFNKFYQPYYKHIKKQDLLYKLILINVLVFFILVFIKSFFVLFKLDKDLIENFFRTISLSADLSTAFSHPWSFVTYMFLHSGFLHIILNMLVLFFFGKNFINSFGSKKFLSLYFLGGFSGAFLYLFVYQTIPALVDIRSDTQVIGASAAVMAVVFATATSFPSKKVMLFFIGEVKLKYIAIGLILIDIMRLAGENSGGHFSHIGGALFGFLYAYSLKRGYDLGNWFSSIIDAFKVQKSKKQFTDITNSEKYKKRKNKQNVNQNQDFDSEEIDKILDKISKSGYSSLTEKEKIFLFSQSKKIK